MNDDAAVEQRPSNTVDAGADYVEAGQGKAVISIGDDGRVGLRQSDAILARQRRVTCFSLEAVSSSCQLAATRIAATIDKMQLGQFDLIGHGAGADVALWLAKLKGKSVRSLVLVAPRGDDGQAFDDVKCPVLTLFGTNDEQVSLRHQQQARVRPSHSHLMYVYDAGVSIGDERPEALAFIANEFFERRNEFLVSRDSGLVFP